MKTSADIGRLSNVVHRLRAEQGYTVPEVAARTGIPAVWLSVPARLTVEEFALLAEVLGSSASRLLQIAETDPASVTIEPWRD